MPWPTADQLMSLCPPADGYAFDILRRSSVPEVIDALRAWQPAWQVGAASVFTRTRYYERFVHLEGEDASDRNVFVILLRGPGGLAGMLAAEQIPDALSLYASLAVLAPEHRGRRSPMFQGDYLEAAYCNVLAPRDALLQPRVEDMTPRVRALYERFYPGGWPSDPAPAGDGRQAQGA
jgi:hypothetical protein